MAILNTNFQKNNLYLLDEHFLNEMAEQKQRDIYARIISLDIDENPIEQIEGKITTGSINIDGGSAVRRTCSLTMVSQEVNITNYYWGVKTKFKLEIGLKNKINKDYPDIIWYPQGIYVITTFNTSLSTNNCTISIQGKDKMCLLNGDVSGQMYASIDFGTEEVIKTEMNAVDFSYTVNSAQIMSQAIQKYYICDFSGFTSNSIPSSISKENNSQYIFIDKTRDKNINKNSYYYNFNKQENKYDGKGTTSTAKRKYKLYKKIENPNEIFQEQAIYKRTYKKNFFFNKENGQSYYTIETRDAKDIFSDDSTPKIFYALKNIYIKNDNLTKEKIPLEKIIREAVHTYGKEPYYNIIINDLESYGLEQLTYKGDITLYALKDLSSGEFTQLVRKGAISTLDEIINNTSDFQFEPRNSEIDNNATKIYYNTTNKTFSPTDSGNNISYTVAKFEYGDDIGYRLTDLVYTGDLVSNVGDSLTSVLDKIKTMLGDFEYFYDLEGHFVFQRKRTYISVSWNTMVDNNDEKYFTFTNDESKFSFNFEGNRLISAIQNSPKITNLRNDFSVWGKRKNTSGVDVDIHMRYAVDKKPIYYKALDGKIYITNTNICLNKNINWINLKTLIKYLQIPEENYDSFFENILSSNGCTESDIRDQFLTKDVFFEEGDSENIHFCEAYWGKGNDKYNYQIYLYGNTVPLKTINDYLNLAPANEGDYNEFYIYIPSSVLFINLVDWREIIYQMALDYFAGQGCSNKNPIFLSDSESYLTDPDQFLYEVGKRNPEYYPTGYTGYEQYYTDMQGFWRQLYNPEYVPEVEYENGHYNNKNWTDSVVKKTIYEYYSTADLDADSNKLYWNKAVFESPETLNFWIDFLDSNLELSKFSVPQIGDRSKTVKDDKAGAIVYKEIPNLILYEPKYEDSEEESEYKKRISQRAEIINKSGYRFINLSKGFSQFFTISYRSKSVKDKVDDLLYEHSYAQDGITITSIPIYHLEPNTIIYVKDDNTGINGEYIATKFTIPLNYNGTMSITANKAPERIY